MKHVAPVTDRIAHHRARPRRRGLGLVEMLISLAIAAALLTAVGAAFSASAQAIEINDEFSRASQSGRVCLHHLLTEIRRGTVGETSTSTSLDVITESGEDRTYRYLADLDQIVLVTNGDLTDRDYVLARNVIEAPFTIPAPEQDDLGLDYIPQVSIGIAVQVGENTVRYSGSAAPRQFLTYE